MNNRPIYIFILVLLMLLGPATVAAQQVFSARVVDADSHEPLPFVKVYSRTAQGTLTNYEGRFQISTQPTDTLEISLVGYTTQRIIAGNLPKTIRMSVRSQQMREVTVTPIQPFLVRASKQLAKEFKQNKGQTSTFFLRMRQDYFQDSVTWAGLKRQMIEAFVSGQSAVNLRNPQIITGYRSGYAPEGLHGDAYQWIQIGAMVLGDDLFLTRQNVVTPLHPKASTKYYKEYYVINEKTVRGEHGQNLRRITFRTYTDVTCPIIIGTLLIDYDTMQPLSFDGYLENVTEWLRIDNYRALERTRPHFRIQYRHDRGFTEVASLFVRDQLSKKDERNTLVNMGQMTLPPGVQVTGDNLYASIDAAGFDPDFWSEHETVMRTDDEEYLFRHSENNPTADQTITDSANIQHLTAAERRYLMELQRRNNIALKRIRGSVVLDASTFKPIPFTDVTVLGHTRTVTNLKGFYTIDYLPTDTLLFQAQGYEPLKLLGKDVKRAVRLTPFREVAKNPEDIDMVELLNQIGNQMEEQLEAHRTDSANYHFRRIRTLLNDTVMTEAFLQAPSVVKLAEPKVLMARNYYVEQPEALDSLGEVHVDGAKQGNFDMLKDQYPDIGDDQLAKLAQILPRTVQRSWEQMELHKRDFDRPYAPLLGVDKPKQYAKMYEPIGEDHIPFSFLQMARRIRQPSEFHLLEDQAGHRYCRITLKRRWIYRRNEQGDLIITEAVYPTTVGHLLIDLENKRLLSFDGYIRGVETESPSMRDFVTEVKYKPDVNIRYDFAYDHGYPEIWHYAFNVYAIISGQTKHYTDDWFTMFNTRGMDLNQAGDGLEHATLRLEEEERMARQEPQTINELHPRFILFDIFSETSNWRLFRR